MRTVCADSAGATVDLSQKQCAIQWVYLQVFPHERGAIDAVKNMKIFNTDLYLLTTVMTDDQDWNDRNFLAGKKNSFKKQGLLRAISDISAIIIAINSSLKESSQYSFLSILDNYFVFTQQVSVLSAW